MRLIGMVDTTEGHGKREMEDLLHSLYSKGFIESNAELGDILSLSTEDVLSRRLQAQVYLQGTGMHHEASTSIGRTRSNLHR